MDDKHEQFKGLKEKLDESTTFPTKYLYKFIVPADQSKVEEIEAVFNFGGAVINTKDSKTGKYTSISILIEMQSSDEIIEKYLEVGKVKGVISL
ncbi:MAG: DUF493 family protein [Flavobacteriaceae bacterium]